MADKAWKQAERRAAKFFGTVRRPLSGMNSRSGGRDDSMHERLFIETKYRKYHPIFKLYLVTRELAKKENKIPLVMLLQKGYKGSLIVMHQEDVLTIAREANIANSIRTLPTAKKFKPKRNLKNAVSSKK